MTGEKWEHDWADWIAAALWLIPSPKPCPSLGPFQLAARTPGILSPPDFPTPRPFLRSSHDRAQTTWPRLSVPVLSLAHRSVLTSAVLTCTALE